MSTEKQIHLAQFPWGIQRIKSVHAYQACVGSADGWRQFTLSSRGAFREARRQQALGRQICIVPVITLKQATEGK